MCFHDVNGFHKAAIAVPVNIIDFGNIPNPFKLHVLHLHLSPSEGMHKVGNAWHAVDIATDRRRGRPGDRSIVRDGTLKVTLLRRCSCREP